MSTYTPALPENPVAGHAVELLRSKVTEAIAGHCIRSYLFAALLAEHEGLKAGVDFDADQLFYATALHDVGTSPAVPGKERFEVEGADLAVEFLTAHGYAEGTTGPVWEAIALHSSGGLAERSGPLCYLTRRGVMTDFGLSADFVTDAQADAIHAQYPRLDMASVLVDDVLRHAARSPQSGARFTFAGELAREVQRHGRPTELEIATCKGRWGA
jgi:hypothetical protein